MMNNPREIDLNITNRCNLSCKYCAYNSSSTEKKELSIQKVFEIIDAAADMGVRDLHITGGEPTLHNDLETIIHYANIHKLNQRLITNGLAIDRYALDRFRKLGLENIMFSVDGPEHIHDKLRGYTGAYKRVMQTIEDAVALDFKVRVNSVVTTENIELIREFLNVLESMKIDIYSAFIFTPIGRGMMQKHLSVSSKRWIEFVNEIKSTANMYKMEIVLEQGYINRSEYVRAINSNPLRGAGAGCSELGRAYDYIVITPDGKVWPCVLLVGTENYLLDLNTESLRNLIKKNENSQFYRALNKTPHECSDCSNADVCKGGCRGYSQIATDSFFNKDPRCINFNATIFPVCPIMKVHCKTGNLGGSTEQSLNTYGNTV
jgi:pyrroloquinoline quinone biosynthesis protein E